MSPDPAPSRTPAPPDALARWVERYGEGVSPTATGPALISAGCTALEAALRLPPAEREAAWALLAADALVTWSVEDAAGASDPEQELARILETVSRVDPSP
jgi:hypothetical protein